MDVLAKRLKSKDYWMKTMRTIYLYDLNEKARARKHDSESARHRNNNDYLKNDTITDFFTNINNIQKETKYSFYKIRVMLNNLK